MLPGCQHRAQLAHVLYNLEPRDKLPSFRSKLARKNDVILERRGRLGLSYDAKTIRKCFGRNHASALSTPQLFRSHPLRTKNTRTLPEVSNCDSVNFEWRVRALNRVNESGRAVSGSGIVHSVLSAAAESKDDSISRPKLQIERNAVAT